MYIFGFREGWLYIFPDHPALMVDIIVFYHIVYCGVSERPARVSYPVYHISCNYRCIVVGCSKCLFWGDGARSPMDMVSFRPTFPVPHFVPLIGTLGCLFTMFIINATFGLIAIAFVVIAYLYLSNRQLKVPYGDMRSGLQNGFAVTGRQRTGVESQFAGTGAELARTEGEFQP